jgi:hypothetical protein
VTYEYAEVMYSTGIIFGYRLWPKKKEKFRDGYQMFVPQGTIKSLVSGCRLFPQFSGKVKDGTGTWPASLFFTLPPVR